MRTKTVKNKGCNDFHFECKIQCYISYDITFVKIKGFLSHGTEWDCYKYYIIWLNKATYTWNLFPSVFLHE